MANGSACSGVAAVTGAMPITAPRFLMVGALNTLVGFP
jgi:putative flippase GtrA